MTRAAVLAWLAARRPAPPPGLAARLAASVSDVLPDLPLAHQLGWLGARALARVIARPEGRRELALELLAADAFVTYAFEAQAEVDVTGLAALAERVVRQTP